MGLLPGTATIEIVPPDGFTIVEPKAINDDGVVVGFMSKPGRTEPHGFRFSVDDGTAIGRAVGERVLCSDR